MDEKNGGFVGQIDCQNNIHNDAEKGSVLNARLLWTFSAAYKISKDKEHLDTAKRAFEYIAEHFYDTEYGGIFGVSMPMELQKTPKTDLCLILCYLWAKRIFFGYTRRQSTAACHRTI